MPATGPVFLVAAPHANQFIDPAVVVATSPRRVGFLTAKVSLDTVPAVKVLGKAMAAIPVPRPQDYAVKGEGLIYLDNETESTLKGIGTAFKKQLHPRDLITLPNKETAEAVSVSSDTEAKIKHSFTPSAISLLTLSNPARSAVDRNQIPDSVLAPPPPPTPSQPKRSALTRTIGTIFGLSPPARKIATSGSGTPSGWGLPFKITPHLDQSRVYAAVHSRLHAGGAVGIFPEGGSHDQPELLPLKAGVVLMALGAMAENEDCDVKLVPVGLHYFNRLVCFKCDVLVQVADVDDLFPIAIAGIICLARISGAPLFCSCTVNFASLASDRFRSRVAVEYGPPVSIPASYVQMYKAGGEQKHRAISELLSRISSALKSVTINAPDYDVLRIVQTARRLLRPVNRKLTEHENLELTRRLMSAYLVHKDSPPFRDMMDRLLGYHQSLETYGIGDAQLADPSLAVGGLSTLRILIVRAARLFTMLLLALPGSFLVLPPMYFIRRYALDKARKAKQASSVKLTGQDVISTVGLRAPYRINVWSSDFVLAILQNKIIFGSVLIPTYFFFATVSFSLLLLLLGAPWYTLLLFPIFYFSMFYIAWMTIRLGEIGTELRNSIWALLLATLDPGVTDELRIQRAALQKDLDELVEEYAPSIVENYEEKRILGKDELDYNEYVSASLIQRKKPAMEFKEWVSERRRTQKTSHRVATDHELFFGSMDFGGGSEGLVLHDAASEDDDEIDEVETENWNAFLGSI